MGIRGTDDAPDFLEDAKLSLLGFANDQAISLYRYYRELITPGGQRVQYTADERALLHRLNVSVPGLPLIGVVSDALLDSGLDSDVGITRADGQAGSVLRPDERLTVTGHSLGGHLALLFGRLFPQATDQIFTYNAPGIAPWGNVALNLAGVGPNDASRVVNIVSANGMDFTAAFGSRPGTTYRVFNEAGSPLQNHSIVPLADSLALYEVFGKLSPRLANSIDEVSSILAAASAKPSESLESTLDDLRRTLMGDTGRTLIASAAADQNQRNDFYTRLYDLRDTKADGTDWGISSLATLSSLSLQGAARTDMAVRRALQDLTPFAIDGAPTDPALASQSAEWLAARSDLMAQLMESRTADRGYALSGSSRNTLFIDASQDLRLAALNPLADIVARNFTSSDEALQGYLSGLSYSGEYFFGKDDAAHGDVVDGTQTGDQLFGGSGDDVLRGGAGDDVLEGDHGADTLQGGDGYDVYVADAQDTIADSDGQGEVQLGDSVLDGGDLGADGSYASSDGAHRYEFSGDLGAGGTLIVDGGLHIENFANGDLGIDLSGTPADGTPGATDYAYHGDESSTQFDEFGNPIGNGIFVPEHDDTFFGRPGNTLVDAGTGIDYVVDRYGGNDVLLLGAGQDFGFGGDGNDWIEGGPGNDFLLGGRGNDTVFATTASTDIDIPIANESSNLFRKEFVSGGEGDDLLLGSGATDYIEGGAGSDTIYGGAGDDTLLGDDVALSYEAGEYASPEVNHPLVSERTLLDVNFYFGPFSQGYDYTYDASVGAGNDVIHAGAGNDFVDAGGGEDIVYGDAGNDRISGGAGNDALHGGEGNDMLDGGPGDDRLYGGPGDDTLTGGEGSDFLDGGGGHDTYVVGDGDSLVANDGASIFARPDGGVPVAATILFGPGISPSDVVLGIDGSGWIAGFAGDGQISFQGPLASWTGIEARFADGTQWTQDDFLARAPTPSDTASLTEGTPGNDFFLGTAAPEHFAGGAGDDIYILTPGGGQDSIDDSAGNDGLGFFGVASGEVSVQRDAQDYLIDYPGGEVRLVSQADPSKGVEALFFQGDGAAWSRADLDARAGGAPVEPAAPAIDQDPLGVSSATVGQPFRFSLASDAFAQEHPAGTATYDAATLEGPLPAWLSVDHHTGTLTGTPAAGDAGVSTLLIAIKDDDKLLTVRPLALVVEAPAAAPTADLPADNSTAPAPSTPTDETALPSVSASADAAPISASDSHASGGAGADTSTQTSQLSVPQAEPPAPAPASGTPAESSTLAAEAAVHQAFAPAPPVGVIQDAVYVQIGSLLFSPATLHASSFMDRYSESVQQFQEREAAPQDSVPAPTEEEIGAYNAVLHAWLDEDMRRMSALETSEARDPGAPEIRYAESASALERLLGISPDSFARPGLAEPKSLQPRPNLQEGFSQINS